MSTACLCGGCGAPAATRGLSRACYQRTIKAVNRREVTWSALVAAGKALPKQKTGKALSAIWWKNKKTKKEA